MATDYLQSDERTVLLAPFLRGLGELRVAHPPGTFALTPASLTALRAVAGNQHLLAGVGLDWGCGTGCLALAAARVPAVTHVLGLELVAANVAVARENARANGLAEKTTFLVSDSYCPVSPEARRLVDARAGRVDFLLANPPASDGDDGFGWRRRVLAGARPFLTTGGRVFLSVSSQYGLRRVKALPTEAPGFCYGGLLATTDWVPFDLGRPDLLECLRQYAREEERGGTPYSFHDPNAPGVEGMDARTALARFDHVGDSPLMKWQVHLFTHTGAT